MTAISEPPGEEVLEDDVPLGKFGVLGAGLEEGGDGHRGNGQHQTYNLHSFSGKKSAKSS